MELTRDDRTRSRRCSVDAQRLTERELEAESFCAMHCGTSLERAGPCDTPLWDRMEPLKAELQVMQGDYKLDANCMRMVTVCV